MKKLSKTQQKREEQQKAQEIENLIKQGHIPSDVTQDTLIQEKSLLEDFETQLSSNEPIRELFNSKNVKFKTELTQEQRSAVSILYQTYRKLLLKGFDLPALKFVLDEYIDFGVSIDRKGRSEYVDAHKSYLQQQAIQGNQQNQQQNLQNIKM